MVAKIDLISEASHKHAKDITALCFDGEHLYSGSEDGVINVRLFIISKFWKNLRTFLISSE